MKTSFSIPAMAAAFVFAASSLHAQEAAPSEQAKAEAAIDYHLVNKDGKAKDRARIGVNAFNIVCEDDKITVVLDTTTRARAGKNYKELSAFVKDPEQQNTLSRMFSGRVNFNFIAADGKTLNVASPSELLAALKSIADGKEFQKGIDAKDANALRPVENRARAFCR